MRNCLHSLLWFGWPSVLLFGPSNYREYLVQLKNDTTLFDLMLFDLDVSKMGYVSFQFERG